MSLSRTARRFTGAHAVAEARLPYPSTRQSGTSFGTASGSHCGLLSGTGAILADPTIGLSRTVSSGRGRCHAKRSTRTARAIDWTEMSISRLDVSRRPPHSRPPGRVEASLTACADWFNECGASSRLIPGLMTGTVTARRLTVAPTRVLLSDGCRPNLRETVIP